MNKHTLRFNIMRKKGNTQFPLIPKKQEIEFKGRNGYTVYDSSVICYLKVWNHCK